MQPAVNSLELFQLTSKASLLSPSVINSAMKFCIVSSAEHMLVEERIGLDRMRPPFQKWEFV